MCFYFNSNDMKSKFLIIILSAYTCWANAASFRIPNHDVASFIAAIQASNINDQTDTIYLPLKGHFVLTVAGVNDSFGTEGPSGLPDVAKDGSTAHRLVVFGNGSTIERDTTAAAFRIWEVGTGILELNDVVIKNGKIINSKNGAGMANYNELYLYNCTFVNNKGAFLGGAIYSVPYMEVTNCTITQNSANTGGAIYFYSSNGSITTSTICRNVSTGVGARALTNVLIVDDPARRVYLKSTIVALNTNGTVPSDIGGVFKTLGNNLVGENSDPNALPYVPVGNPNLVNDYVGTPAAPMDPLLDTLKDNGGLTPTIAIRSTSSPAFNHGGSVSYIPLHDQAGNSRLGNPEIGSLELDNNSILDPHINIKFNNNAINNASGVIGIGSTLVGQSFTSGDISIENTGFGRSLNLLGRPSIFLSGNDVTDFVVQSSGMTSTVAGGNTTVFHLVFSPTSIGLKQITVSIASSDVSVPIFTFTVTALGVSGSVVTQMASDDSDPNEVSIYPNPTAGGLAIQTIRAAHVTVVNAMGKEVANFSTHSQQPEHVFLEKSGIYLIKVDVGDKVMTKEVIVQE